MFLWLDDERDPKDFGLPDAVWVKDFWEFKAFMFKEGNAEKLTAISFDHDLGMRDRDHDGNDCADMVLRLAHLDKPCNYGMDLYVHSMNPVGADRILKTLQEFQQEAIEMGYAVGECKRVTLDYWRSQTNKYLIT